MRNPVYLNLLEIGELKRRVEILHNMLSNCVLCPHQCQVNRLIREKGYCKTTDKIVLSGAEAHFGEEEELVGMYGSGTIFFSHCNLGCVFGQNYEISHCGIGEVIDSHELAKIMLRLQRKKCHNINLVSPGHIVPQIVEAIYIAAQNGLNIPIIYNTNGYDLKDTLKLLEGIIDIYLPDIKFADDSHAQKYMKVKDYPKIAKAAVEEMYRQVGNLKTDDRGTAFKGLLIRHLVMPQNLAGTVEIMQFIAERISKEAYVNIMAQYSPEHQAYQFNELSRRITEEEYQYAVNTAKDAGLLNVKFSTRM